MENNLLQKSSSVQQKLKILQEETQKLKTIGRQYKKEIIEHYFSILKEKIKPYTLSIKVSAFGQEFDTEVGVGLYIDKNNTIQVFVYKFFDNNFLQDFVLKIPQVQEWKKQAEKEIFGLGGDVVNSGYLYEIVEELFTICDEGCTVSEGGSEKSEEEG